MISIRGVTFSYSNHPALQGIDLRIAEGERVAIMGPNGSGKSTLAMLVKGLIIPDEGEIAVDGVPPGEAPPGKVGMVFQNPEDQIAAATVEREIAFGLENIRLPRNEMIERVDEALKQYGLESYRHHPPHKLSGGQMQKLALASACAMKPDYLLLDEPTSLLDQLSRRDFLTTLDYQPPTTGIIFITQFPGEALSFERLVVLAAGEVFFDGEPGEFFADESLTASASIEPPVKFTLSEILKRDYK